MKSMYLASTALALVLSTGVAFADPTATITDAGTSNVAMITQNSGVNAATDATITQHSGSSANQAYIAQAGAGENKGTIDQVGAGNYAAASQDDSGSADSISLKSTVEVKQDGNDIANVSQGGGYHHDALISQGGGVNSNRADVSQNGSNTYAYIEHPGSGNYANISQTGTGGTAATVWQTGSSNQAYVTQTGAGFEYTEVTQDGISGSASITQSGKFDSAFLYRSVAAILTQQGTGDLMSIVQMGDGNSMSAVQLGNGNSLEHLQLGSGLSPVDIVQQGGAAVTVI